MVGGRRGVEMPGTVRLDEQFVERLVGVGRYRYGNGGQLEPFDGPLLDAAAGTDVAAAAAASSGTAYGTATDATGGTASSSSAVDGRLRRQRQLLAIGPAAVVVLGQKVRAPGLPYGPHRYAVPDVRVLVDGADVDGRVDAGSRAQQVPHAPVQRVGQAAAHQVPL